MSTIISTMNEKQFSSKLALWGKTAREQDSIMQDLIIEAIRFYMDRLTDDPNVMREDNTRMMDIIKEIPSAGDMNQIAEYFCSFGGQRWVRDPNSATGGKLRKDKNSAPNLEGALKTPWRTYAAPVRGNLKTKSAESMAEAVVKELMLQLELGDISDLGMEISSFAGTIRQIAPKLRADPKILDKIEIKAEKIRAAREEAAKKAAGKNVAANEQEQEKEELPDFKVAAGG